MAQITLTSGSPPAFLSKNYINRDAYNNGGIVVSTGDSLKDRIYDMTPTSLWSSSGSSDGDEQTIAVTLFEGSSETSRSMDFVALLGNNFKNFIVEYKATAVSAWATVTGTDYTGTDNAATNFVVSLATPVTCVAVQVRCNNTIVADEEKQLGVFIVALGTFQTTNSMSKFKQKPDESVKSLMLLDGTYDETAIYRDTASFTFWNWSVMWRFVGDAERNNFHTVRTSIDPFLWYPEPGEQAEEIYLARIKRGSFKEPYSTSYKTAGRDIEFSIFETGGG